MRQLLAVAVLAVLVECSPATTPQLSMRAVPAAIDDKGAVTEITITAVDARGMPGTGAVKVTSVAGSLRESETVTLDAEGKATVGFTCPKVADALCKERVRVVAEWVVNGELIGSELRISVGEEFTVGPRVGVDWGPDDAGYLPWSAGPCLQTDAGAASSCFPDGGCQRGFTCVYGATGQQQCVLRGGTGDVQVTLRFKAPVDLDLHVYEPRSPDAGSFCHIYYGDTGPNNSCGSKGSLDLDTNAGCTFDRVDVENVIYPANRRAPKGEYSVDVDYWSSCSIQVDVPWQVEVRAGGEIRFFCSSYTPAMNGTQLRVTKFVLQ